MFETKFSCQLANEPLLVKVTRNIVEVKIVEESKVLTTKTRPISLISIKNSQADTVHAFVPASQTLTTISSSLIFARQNNEATTVGDAPENVPVDAVQFGRRQCAT